MSGLNPPQREAIRYLDGPLLVLAGAGSGKTRVITQKIAYLIQDCGFRPGTVAAITFTNKAAKEMHERVARLLGGQTAAEVQISTFHSLGVRFLREEARALGYKPRFSIFDAADCAGIIGDPDPNRASRPSASLSSHRPVTVSAPEGLGGGAWAPDRRKVEA